MNARAICAIRLMRACRIYAHSARMKDALQKLQPSPTNKIKTIPMTEFRKIARGILAAVLLSLPCAAFAQTEGSKDIPVKMPENMTAEMEMSQGGNVMSTTKMFKKGGMMRVEAELSAGGQTQKSISIFNEDEKKMYTLMPDQKQYMVTPLSEEQLKMFDPTKQDATYELQGEEEVNGAMTEKYLVTNADGQQFTMFVNKETRFPAKIVVDDQGVEINYKNVTTEVPADDLFEVPGEYSELSMPAAPAAP